MIVSRKYRNNNHWKNLEGKPSRLSGPYWGGIYRVNGYFHRLYGRYYFRFWEINAKILKNFKEVYYDSF